MGINQREEEEKLERERKKPIATSAREKVGSYGPLVLCTWFIRQCVSVCVTYGVRTIRSVL